VIPNTDTKIIVPLQAMKANTAMIAGNFEDRLEGIFDDVVTIVMSNLHE